MNVNKCAKCPSIALEGKSLCAICGEKSRIHASRRRERNKSAGLCQDCSSPDLVPGKRRCALCLGKSREKSLKWTRANIERSRENAARWKANNPERAKAKRAQWSKDNPEKCRAHSANRRARRLQANGSYTAEQMDAKAAQFNNACFYCGGPYEQNDHFYPLSKSLDNTLDNIVPACAKCNASKSDSDPLEWMQSQLLSGKALTPFATEFING